MVERRRSFLLSVALVLAASSAAAQPGAASREAQAEALFRDANELVAAGRFAEACRKLDLSEHLDPALGTRYNLAVCLELSGKIVAASRLLSEVAAEADAAGKTERARAARARRAAIEPRKARVRVRAPGGVAVTLDGVALLRDVAADVETDPGAHRVEATAMGGRAWARDVVATEGALVEIDVPDLAPPDPVAAARVSARTIDRPATPPAEQGWDTRRWIGMGTLGTGIAGVALGGIFGARALSKRADLSQTCPSYPLCSGDRIGAARDLDDSGRSAAAISTWALIGGGAALAVGAVLVLGAPAKDGTSVRVAPMARGAAVEGTW